MRKMIGILLIVIVTMTLCSCGGDDLTDQVSNIVQAEDEHVISVKEGTPNAYPEKTYEEAFGNFFGSPTWKYFVGTKEGTDDDGDGKPDFKEENVDIVEFTGYCNYLDVEVKALIQFTLSKDDDTFEATYLSFNDVPQNMFTLLALLEAAFTDEDIGEDVEEAVEDSVDEEVLSQQSEDDYILLNEFIDLVCSYGDAPDLETEELEDYFKREFDAWISGEGYTNIIMDAEGHLVIPDHSADYTGEWWDTYSERCYMEIGSNDGIDYDIDINWGSSAWDNTHWDFYGIYDEELGGIYYCGSRIEEYYSDDGEIQETYVYSDGEGLIWIGDDGMLYWDDYVEQQGMDCSFERGEH